MEVEIYFENKMKCCYSGDAGNYFGFAYHLILEEGVLVMLKVI